MRASLFETAAPALIDCKSYGATDREAAKVANVSRKTLYAWLQRGRAGEEPFATFARRFDEAEKAAKDSRLAKLIAALTAPDRMPTIPPFAMPLAATA